MYLLTNYGAIFLIYMFFKNKKYIKCIFFCQI